MHFCTIVTQTSQYLINVAFESFGIDEIAPLKKTDMKIEIQMDFSNQ